MNITELLTLITDPVSDDYFPGQFLLECQSLKELECVDALTAEPESLFDYKQVLPADWHAWFENYINLNRVGAFPFIWPFRQNMIGFDFKAELDDFESEDTFFSLGTDPAGDWFVMTQQNGCEVRLCDHHMYHLYDFWLNPNHLLAWALRSALADENGFTKDDVLAFWNNREQRIEKVTMDRIVVDLS